MLNPKKPEKKMRTKEKTKDDISLKKQEESLKRSVYSVTTPRSYAPKTTTSDIYIKKNAAQVTKAPKKTPGISNTSSNISPMKDILKSTSSVQLSARSRTNKTGTKVQKPIQNIQKSKNVSSKTTKPLPMNVTVNSPNVKRKLTLEELRDDRSIIQIKDRDKVKTELEMPKERQRTKTRTLDEGEVKVLTADAVDNNAQMAVMTNKLAAKSKAFYINLDEDKKVDKDKLSEEEISYEDDFESYESDFDSYKSSQSEVASESPASASDDGDDDDGREGNSKEERMMDSGHFDMRDSRSANKATPLDFIVETSEEVDKKTSLTDEGFQEMSSSSGTPSMRTVHVDVLERPLFIDFTKSKVNSRKRRNFERLKKRADDILKMVTLHEMSYSLFEIKPIPYDLYMATFDRENYNQAAVQTFEDGVNAEIQTDEIYYENKWTQFPIEFSYDDICLNIDTINKVSNKGENAYQSYLFFEEPEEQKIDESFRINNLRIYLEQKVGCGTDKILSYEAYHSKLKNKQYDANKLGKFLKKIESRVYSILSINAKNTDMSNLIKTSKYTFSGGYLSLSTKNITDNRYSFLKQTDITGIVFCRTKNNLLFTIHNKLKSGVTAQKCILCLWDLSNVIFEPIKILIATDNVKFGIFSEAKDSYFIGALDDGSIQLWNLVEEATWLGESSHEQLTEVTNESLDNLTTTERDRIWNVKNLNDEKMSDMTAFQASSFTTSAANMTGDNPVDPIVALEYLGESQVNVDLGSRKLLGQVCTLQRVGLLTIWSVIQEKSKKYLYDLGRAYWSRVKLEKNLIVNLSEYIYDGVFEENNTFNLNAARKRLANKRSEKNSLNIESPHPGSVKLRRPASATSLKKSKTVFEKNVNLLNNSIVCNNLAIMNYDKCDHYIVAKNCGEVVCCTRIASAVKVHSLCVGSSASLVTSIVASPHGLPYFLAATDCGTINMCSFNSHRVLLTLDCRSSPPSTTRYLSDHKGRFLGSSEIKNDQVDALCTVSRVVWSPTNPFSIVGLTADGSVRAWELTHSDMQPRSVCDNAAVGCAVSDKALALVTPDGEVQVHRLVDNGDHLALFQKYVALL